jgi:hypothetical protein
MIDRDHALPITRQASLLGMSRGSVYYLPRATSEADLELMRRIDELHLEFPFMGARMLRRQLHRQGVEVGRLHVRTLMLRMGIQAMAPQPGSSKPAPGHKIYPYLLRNLVVDRPNQVWALDTTYIPMRQGFVYLTAIVDVAIHQAMAPLIFREKLFKQTEPLLAWSDGGALDFASRIGALFLEGDIVVNACTKGRVTGATELRRLVHTELTAVLPIDQVLKRCHPSKWNMPLRRSYVW